MISPQRTRAGAAGGARQAGALAGTAVGTGAPVPERRKSPGRRSGDRRPGDLVVAGAQ